MIAIAPAAAPKPVSPWSEAFTQFASDPRRSDPAWLADLRTQCLAAFERLGWPSPEHEDWRFTPLTPLTKLPFHLPTPAHDETVPDALIERAPFTALPGCRLVFVNGRFIQSLSRRLKLPGATRVESIAALLNANPDLLRHHLGASLQVPPADDPFVCLNTAFFEDGVLIHVPAHVQINEPIQLIFVSSATQPGSTTHPRVIVHAEDHSRVTIIEQHISITDTPCFANPILELSAGPSAHLEYLKLQDQSPRSFHVATVHGRFDRASQVYFHSFAFGARISRNNIRVKLDGPGLETVLNGLYLTRGTQLADHHMIVEHAQPHCASHEYFNGILDDQSKGVFHGRILVQPIAQKTDAKQTNKNLLLSDAATVDAKPQLEIYADDVRCTHGATVGQLDEKAVFYLRSRGIGLERARRILMHAFAGEIVDRVQSEAARNILDRLIHERLEASPSLHD